ncbi:hypothetical protein [Aliikangiella maris]|uniref:Uncharacterized protein n=2 Tax=Aliikangiella maris TaxID=3162458 RepID=A0ABV3MQV3_9GAMM
MSQITGIVQDPQFLRSQVVAQQSSRAITVHPSTMSSHHFISVFFASLSYYFSYFSFRYRHFF